MASVADPAFTDDSSRRGKRKRDNQFDAPDTPASTRRQSSRSQYQSHSPIMGSAGQDGNPETNGSNNQFDVHPAEHHQSNNQFDLAGLAEHTHGSAAHNAAAVAAAGQATAAAALHQDFTMNVPPHPGSGFGEIATSGQEDGFGMPPDTPNVGDPNMSQSQTPSKPIVGSEEWHKVRKDNHKEVERRRRETINEGINELAKIVPGCEKNKGSILARAVQYIQKLQEDASTNIDKWTFEKLVTEQAINELSEKVTKAYREKEAWKRVAKDAGVDVDHIDLGLPDDGPGEHHHDHSHTHDSLAADLHGDVGVGVGVGVGVNDKGGVSSV